MATDTVKIDDLQRLRRFFYLGNDHGLYRVRVGPERCLSAESAPIVNDLLAKGRGEEVVEEVVKFLSGDRTCCTNHAPALFTLAMCARFEDQSQTTKQAAVKAMGKACSSTADLFQFISFAQCLRESRRGWGRSLKNGVQRWFDSKTSMELAEIVTRQKTGSKWSYIDLLRVTHVVPKTEGAKMIVRYLARSLQAAEEEFGGDKASPELKETLAYLGALEQLKTEKDVAVAVGLIEEYKFHPKQVAPHLQQFAQVVAATLTQVSLVELLHNIGNLARRALLEPVEPVSGDIVQRIQDEEYIRKEKLSPIAVLIAMRVYEQGSSLKWTRNGAVVEALNNAFATALKYNVESTNKRYLLAININNQFLCWVHGARVLSPVIAAASIAVILAHTEKEPTMAFFNKEVRPLSFITSVQMPEICEKIVQCATAPEAGRSKCDLVIPIMWAQKASEPYDVIIIMTDHRNPSASADLATAFKQYRSTMKLPQAKLVVCSVTASHIQFADSSDAGMLDIAGFDERVPDVIHKFVTGML
ncbi:60 kDa SS-A/Ro ribonucleoprotein-like [Pomacea canaliculata]|uniref:60 kDa SS-A/Ro ribonucleoprotein-like n=1 Tax=Pomacea canaliculata TaxID=400727 RepID=UPI000D73508D|nr:60 kDa SS-A/Ro ribonucleoprotein-like [Pomacea canaliculata]